MRFSSALVAAAALYLAPSVQAEETAADIKRPSFVPTEIKAPFLEQFTDDWESRWQASHAKKVNDKSTEEEWAYVGTWAVEEPTVLKGIEGDKGLVVKDKAAHHAITAKFPQKIDNKGKTFVAQYEVKTQDGLECAGAYMKLLQDNKALHTEEFSNASPYIVMFGPDKCGATNKVHFIVRHKSPKSGEYEEKHLVDTPVAIIDKKSHLYTLVIRPDDSFTIKIDGASVRNGTFADDFNPPFSPSKEIDDAKDKKPTDWIDEAKITDPEATKPEDWDEDAPMEIVDESAEKPADWLDDEPSVVPDPEAEKPEDWDDEEDGDFEAPLVPNPKCDEASGCGKWEKPTIRNPAYKGKWNAPLIDNPLYKGIWKPKKIANPDYFEAKNVATLEPIGAIGFEIWTMQKDILFDNIYIGHSEADAEALQKETYDVKIAIENKEEEVTKPKESEKPKSPLDLKFADDPVKFVREKLDLFIVLVKRDPIEAVKFMPEVAGGLGVAAVTVLALLLSLLGVGAKSPQVQETARKAKSAAVDAKDKAAEAVTTGAEKAQAELNKRTTRSTAADTS